MLRQAPIFLFMFLAACTGSESTETTEVEGAAATEAPPPPPPADVDVAMPELTSGAQQKVNTAASTIQFTGAKVTKAHEGSFEKFEGVIVLDGDKVLGTQFSIDLLSTNSDSAKLTKHLLSKDFFDAEKFGSAVFVSSEIKAAVEPGAVTHDVKGVLDLHGRQRPLSFPASITVGEAATTVTATFDINRQNWGISYPGSPDNLIKDDVQIRLNLSFPSGTAPVEEAQEETSGEEKAEPAVEAAGE